MDGKLALQLVSKLSDQCQPGPVLAQRLQKAGWTPGDVEADVHVQGNPLLYLDLPDPWAHRPFLAALLRLPDLFGKGVLALPRGLSEAVYADIL